MLMSESAVEEAARVTGEHPMGRSVLDPTEVALAYEPERVERLPWEAVLDILQRRLVALISVGIFVLLLLVVALVVVTGDDGDDVTADGEVAQVDPGPEDGIQSAPVDNRSTGEADGGESAAPDDAPGSATLPEAPATEPPATEPPTTEAPTTEPPTTEPPTTEPPTTEPPTTAPPVVIVSPGPNAVLAWGSDPVLEAVQVPEAREYCWIVESTRTETRCSRSNVTSLRRGDADPGSLSVTLEVRGDGGAILASDRVGVSLLAQNFISGPDDGATVGGPDWIPWRDNQIRLRADRVRSADDYCWHLAGPQGFTDELCGNRRVDLDADQIRSIIGSGPITIRARAFRDGVLIGEDTAAAFLDPYDD